MATYKELVKAYEAAGRPSDTNSIHKLLMDAGLSHEQAVTAFDAAGQYLAPTSSKEPQAEAPQEEQVNIPMDYTITSKTGKEFTWKGAQWVSKGQIVPKQYKDQITQAATHQLIAKKRAAQKDADDAQVEATRKKDADHEFENIPSSSPDAREQQKVEQNQSSPTNHLQDLANKIKASPDRDTLVKSLNVEPQGNKIANIAAFIKSNGLEGQARAELGRYTDR